MNKTIAGVLPVLHTPFLDNDQIDEECLQKQIDWIFQQGADGFCTGMVSELLRLTTDERLELTEKMSRLCAGRGVVVASVGAESTKGALFFARHAQKVGCHGLMAIPPVSTALPGDALYDYYQTLADGVDLPLIVQDASAYAGHGISLDVQAKLFERYGPEKIMFKPEAAPLGPNLSALRDRTNRKAKIFEGSGGIFLVDSFRRGVAGTIPGVDLLDGVVALWRALHRADQKAIYHLYFPLCAIVALQMQAGLDGFLAIEKYILVKRGLFKSDRRRQPYSWSLDEETAAEIDRLLVYLDLALQEYQTPPQED